MSSCVIQGNLATGAFSNSGGLAPDKYDRVDVTYPTATTEVYDFKLDNVTVAVVTLTYSSSTKSELVSAVRT